VYALPENPSMFKIKGGYTNQAIFEALGNGPKVLESSHAWLLAVQRLIKGHQVAAGFLGPHLNSFMDNVKGGVLAGGLDVTRAHKAGPQFYAAARALLDYKKDPTGKTGLGQIILDAKRQGADYFGFGHEEINNPASLKFHKDLAAAFPDPEGSFIERVGDLLHRSMRNYEQGLAWLGSGLDWVDRLFRLQSYISLNDKFIADLAKNGPNSALAREGLLGKNADHPTSYAEAANELRAVKYGIYDRDQMNNVHQEIVEMAGRLASRRINQSFWNPTFVGKGVERIRKSGVGIFAPYATATFENWRVNGGLFLRLKQEPDLKWRLLTTLITMGGATGLAAMYSGVTRDEAAEAYNTIPNGKKAFKPCTFPLPFHDDKGRVQMWNYTQWSEMCRLLQGNQSDPWMNNVLVNLTMTPIQGGLAEQPVRKAFEWAGAVSPIQSTEETPQQTNTGGIALLKYLHRSGMFPGAFKGVVEAARRTEIMPGGQTLGEYV
jgi:hypothetical protein